MARRSSEPEQSRMEPHTKEREPSKTVQRSLEQVHCRPVQNSLELAQSKKEPHMKELGQSTMARRSSEPGQSRTGRHTKEREPSKTVRRSLEQVHCRPVQRTRVQSRKAWSSCSFRKMEQERYKRRYKTERERCTKERHSSGPVQSMQEHCKKARVRYKRVRYKRVRCTLEEHREPVPNSCYIHMTRVAPGKLALGPSKKWVRCRLVRGRCMTAQRS
jgi:hypothetical protein